MALTIPNTFTSGTPAVATQVNGNFSAVKTLLDTVETTANSASTDKVDKNLTLNAQTGTTYTLVLTDSAKVVTLNNASAIALTVPTNASVAFAIGSQVNLVQLGAGQVTVGGASVTLRSQGSKLKLNGQYSAATLLKIATDEWVLVGNTAA
jgi:hypothetical protein